MVHWEELLHYAGLNANDINPYWLEFDPLSELNGALFGAFIIVVCVASLIGNFVITIHSFKYQRWFLGNLAVAQFCISLTYPLVAISEIRLIWTFGPSLCQIIAFVHGLCGMVTIGTFTALVAKNYAQIRRVCSGRRNDLVTPQKTLKSKFLKVSLIWIYAIALTAPPLFGWGWGHYGPNGHLTSCCFDFLTKTIANRLFIIYMFSVGFLCPAALIFYCYIRLFAEIYRLDNASSKRRQQVKKALNQRAAREKVGRKIRSLKIIFLNVVAFLVAWTPFAVVALVGQFFQTIQLGPAAVTMPRIFAKSSTVYMPIIFGFCDPKCKKWFRSCFLWHRSVEAVNRDRWSAKEFRIRATTI